MTEIQPFTFPTTGQGVRTLLVDGVPWFVARDITSILEIVNGADALSRVNPADKGVGTADTPGGPQRMTIVSESGLYDLILESRKPTAREFRRWITAEVVPSIRRTGAYSAPGFRVPASFAEALELAAAQQREIEATKERADRAEFQMLEMAPSAYAWDTLASADGDFSVREASNVLNRDPQIDTGQNRLFKLLREWRLIDSGNRPYANHSQHVRLRPQTRPDPHGDSDADRLPAAPQVRITVQGVRYLHGRLNGSADVNALLAEELSAEIAA